MCEHRWEPTPPIGGILVAVCRDCAQVSLAGGPEHCEADLLALLDELGARLGRPPQVI